MQISNQPYLRKHCHFTHRQLVPFIAGLVLMDSDPWVDIIILKFVCIVLFSYIESVVFERVLFRADNLCVTSVTTVYDPVWAGGQNLRHIQCCSIFFTYADILPSIHNWEIGPNWQTSIQIMSQGGANCQNLGHFKHFSFLL